MWPNPQFPASLFTFAEEILNGKLHCFAMGIRLVEKIWKDFILEKNDDVAVTFNYFFTSVVSKLNIPRYQDPLIDSD